jgi:hypothetical protein
MMTDLGAKILGLRIAGWSEREISHKLGCSLVQVKAALDAHAARKLAPENVLRMLIESLDNVGVIERTFTPRAVAGDVEASKLVAQCRRQRARTAQLILERAPTSNPARFRRPWALRRAGPPLTGIGALSREL